MIYSDKVFKNERIAIDGVRFSRCRFEGCTLVYSGGDLPGFEDCYFDPPKFTFDGAAGNTLAVINALYHGGFNTFVENTFDNIRKNKLGSDRLFH